VVRVDDKPFELPEPLLLQQHDNTVETHLLSPDSCRSQFVYTGNFFTKLKVITFVFSAGKKC